MQAKSLSLPQIAISMGDFNGIGPEVILKALSNVALRETCYPLILGSFEIFKEVNKSLGERITLTKIERIDEFPPLGECVGVLDCTQGKEMVVEPGRISKLAGEMAGKSIKLGAELALNKKVDALVTGPVSKEALNLAGYSYPGQTELLADLTRTEQFAMMLIAGEFRVALVTTHCSISQVPKLLETRIILEKIRVINDTLKERFGIKRPRIAVSALNPHGGEGGLFGSEEIYIIAPAVTEAQELGIDAHGPYPADTLFAKVEKDTYDAYLVMYHDQGLIPLKMRSFGRGVNFTAGLPIIRTSPDHGTAFDIAGRLVAQEGSMKEAIKLAVELAQKNSGG